MLLIGMYVSGNFKVEKKLEVLQFNKCFNFNIRYKQKLVINGIINLFLIAIVIMAALMLLCQFEL